MNLQTVPTISIRTGSKVVDMLIQLNMRMPSVVVHGRSGVDEAVNFKGVGIIWS